MTPTPEQVRDKDFEEWYVCNAFDYAANPIGSRECGLQRKAYAAGRESMLAELMAGVEMPEPFGLFFGVRHDPPKTKEFWGMLNQNIDPQLKCSLYTADQLRETVAAAVLREREACAKVCEGRLGGAVQSNEWWGGFKSAMKQCAAAIRNRSNT